MIMSKKDTDTVETASEQVRHSDITSERKEAGPSIVAKPDAAGESRQGENRDITPREPVEITLRSLLEAGVHFGHQTSRWNPAMSRFIYGVRNGIHVIHLPRTIESWSKAREAIIEVAARGGSILFVGTKKQAQDAVVEEARRCGAYYVSRRWLGGMMTNFQTIRKSIERMNKVEQILAEEEEAQKSGKPTKYTKKERLMMSREREKLEFSLGGIRDMYSSPSLMFVIDTKREDIAIKEATKLDIPVVALVDTNCDPGVVQYPIPSNDDGTRAIRLFCSAVADAVLEGKKTYSKRLGKEVDAAKHKTVPSVVRGAATEPAATDSAPSEAADAADVAKDAADTDKI
jgi:small subunit ribosomal protein S2